MSQIHRLNSHLSRKPYKSSYYALNANLDGVSGMFRILFLLMISCLLLLSSKAFALTIYAHRGGRSLEPENTLPAYRRSLALGVDYIDLDINMTKDGVLVVSHDFALNPDITRNSDGNYIKQTNLLIKNLTLHQLQQFNVGKINPDSQYARVFSKQQSVPYAVIPTLQQAIEEVKKVAGDNVGFQIEIKTDPSHPEWTYSPKKLANALAIILKKEKITNRTEVQAFDWRCLLALQKINPEIITSYLTDADISQAMHSTDPKIAGLWSAGKLLKNYDDSIPKMIASLGGKIWGPEDIEVSAQLVADAHADGLKVVPWPWPEKTGKTLNIALIKKLIRAGVDGIITDRPDFLVNYGRVNSSN